MSTLTAELEQILPRLDVHTKDLVEGVLRNVIDLARTHREKFDVGLDANGYPLGYVESTFGSFANEPLGRAAQGTLPNREDW